MQISTIIPCHNQGRFLARCIDSVLEQGECSREIVVVDNASTDDTAEIASSFGTKVRYFVQENLGPSAARNLGLANVSGDFVHFLDGDDWIAPGMYEAAQKALEKNPNASVFATGQVYVTEQEVEIFRQPAPTRLEDPLHRLLSKPPWGCHAAIARRDAVMAAGSFNAKLWQTEDWDLWIRMAAKNGIFTSFAGEYAFYRQVAKSNSANAIKMLAAAKTVLCDESRWHPGCDRCRECAAEGVSFMKKFFWDARIRSSAMEAARDGQLRRAISIIYSALRHDPGYSYKACRLLLNHRFMKAFAKRGFGSTAARFNQASKQTNTCIESGKPQSNES